MDNTIKVINVSLNTKKKIKINNNILSQPKESPKNRIFIDSHKNLCEEKVPYLSQKEYIKSFLSNNNYDNNSIEENKIRRQMKQEIIKKIGGYRHQDQIKNILDISNLVDFPCLVEKLIEADMKCFYCSCELFIFYNKVREKYQWTVDRIDNTKGHNKDNIVLSCFACNIKRRCQQMHKFYFTKNLQLIKSN